MKNWLINIDGTEEALRIVKKYSPDIAPYEYEILLNALLRLEVIEKTHHSDER